MGNHQKLFICNLDFNTTETDLHDAFAEYGTVVEVNLELKHISQLSRGFGFVTMSSSEEAQAALKGLDGKKLGTREISVILASRP
jgi:heterogeneous nuclear ribonucleoprotein A1/A3